MLEIYWSNLSKITFADEIIFIFSKWNQVEVDTFVHLVYNYLETVTKSTEIGKFNKTNQCYSLVISKQTSL